MTGSSVYDCGHDDCRICAGPAVYDCERDGCRLCGQHNEPPWPNCPWCAVCDRTIREAFERGRVRRRARTDRDPT